jgi:hypothetical protein
VKYLLTLAASLLVLPLTASAVEIVGQDDLDGNTVNLISSSLPALDGGGGDWFGPGSLGAWPQATGVPFGLADDTVVGVSGGSPFASDTEAVYGQNADFANVFFGISDSDEFLDGQVATWTFDISGYENLVLYVGMGGISNASSGGYSLDTDARFQVSIDGGAAVDAIVLTAVDNLSGYVTRPMDSGIASGGGRLLEASGVNGVTKTLADTGAAAADTYLDKTPASGPGAGELDTFSTPITGTGSTLTVTFVCDFPFEAMAFDDLVIMGTSAISADASSFGGLKSEFQK